MMAVPNSFENRYRIGLFLNKPLQAHNSLRESIRRESRELKDKTGYGCGFGISLLSPRAKQTKSAPLKGERLSFSRDVLQEPLYLANS